MRISTLLLADAARVRDGLLSVIGGGVTGIGASTFPMHPQVDLGLIIDVEAGEWPGQLPINVKLEQVLEDGVSTVVSGYEGTYVGELQAQTQPSVVPVALPLEPLEIPAPGQYFVVVEVGALSPARLRVTAREAPGSAAPGQ